MSVLESIPKPVLYGGGALIILLVFMRSRTSRAPQNTGYLDSTLASMQLAAASNIDAFNIAAQRDVALAGEYTARYQIAHQAQAEREGMALDYLAQRSGGKRAITMQQVEHDTIRKGMDIDYALTTRAQDFKREENFQNFRLAIKKLRQDFRLQKKFAPQFFQIELAQLAADKETRMLEFALANRRTDIGETQGLLGYGGIPGAITSLVGSGLDVYDTFRGPSPAERGLAGAASGAASGAAIGSVVPGIGTAIGAGVGAAAGGGGGLS